MVVGGVLGFVAKSNYDSVGDHCRGNVCDSWGETTTNSARSLGDGATVFFAAGAVIAATGAVIWFTAPSRGSVVTERVSLVPGPASVLVRGAF
jgi:hypothetical protein